MKLSAREFILMTIVAVVIVLFVCVFGTGRVNCIEHGEVGQACFIGSDK
jgi:hypothetical protein